MWLRYDGTPYYVGKGHDNRAIRKGSPQDLTRTLIQEHKSEADAFEAEKFLIGFYGRIDLGTGCLRNRTDGGDGVSGYRHTEETRRKLREAGKASVAGLTQDERSDRMRKAREAMSHEARSSAGKRGMLAMRSNLTPEQQISNSKQASKHMQTFNARLSTDAKLARIAVAQAANAALAPETRIERSRTAGLAASAKQTAKEKSDRMRHASLVRWSTTTPEQRKSAMASIRRSRWSKTWMS